ncbi:MAG: NAD(P)-dependent oxidoreductase, partial [Alphaproteobacteria bacterium]|nr:NAD(P)-dependent oxidoreductase [Alphaproteobacteria bacterium]
MATKTIGFIGLGRMGAGMALNLLKAEPSLHVYDVSKKAMDPLIDAGATACASPAEMAGKCDVVLLCLPFAPQVRDVIIRPDGIRTGARDGLTIIDTTTLDRTDALAFGRELDEAGIAYWDCPVSGAPFRADNGTLTVMFGGTPEAFAQASPYLETFGQDVVHAGPLGSGQAMKA